MTTHPFLRLAAIVSLLAAPCIAFAQYNPDPKACACVLIEQPTDGRVSVPADAPAVPAGTIPEDTDGDYKLAFILNQGDTSVCSEVKITKITIRSKADPSLAKTVDVSSTNNGFDTYDDIVVPGGDVAKEDDKTWQIVVATSGSPTGETSGSTSESPSNSDGECYRDFTMGEPCTACSNCASSSSTTPSASNGSFTYTMPLGSSNGGDTKGTLRFYTPDSSFPGLDGISAFVLPSHPVVRASGSITVTTPTVFIEAIPTPNTEDSITISYKASPTTAEFRTNTISRVQDGTTIHIVADSTYEGSTFRYRQTQTAPGTYLLESGPVVGGTFTTLRKETLVITTPQPGTQIRRETVEEADTANTYEIVSDIATTWTNYGWGWEKTQQTTEPYLGGANLVSTWSYYQPGEAQSFDEGLGRLKEYLRFDGYREYHTYGFNSHTTLLPFAGDIDGLTLTRQWNEGHTTRTTTRTVLGKTLSMETESFNGTTITATTYAATGDALTTITTPMPYGAPFGGQPSNISHPDGTRTTYGYTRYGDGGKEVIETTGTASIGKSTTTTYNRHGTVSGKLVRTYGYTPDITLEQFDVTQFDNHGRALETSYFPTSTTEVPPVTTYAWKSSTTYTCCGVKSSTDRYGVPTYHAYDGLGRQTKSNTLGITTETARKGRTTETRRYPETVGENLDPILISGPAAVASLVSKQSRNVAGTQTSSWAPDPSSTTAGALVETTTATTYNLTYLEGVLTTAETITTTTVPDGFQTTVTCADGRISSTIGALQPNMTYSYGVGAANGSSDGIGLVTASAYIDDSAIRETTTTTADWAGRAANVTKGGTGSTNYYYYPSNATAGSCGKLRSVVDADDVRTLYAYNELGERTTTALDVGDTADPHGNDAIDFGGHDQVTVSTTIPGTYGGFSVLTTTTRVYTADGAETTATTTAHRTPDGLHSWDFAAGTTAATAGRAASCSQAGVNWALATQGATAMQSDTYAGCAASRAIDGVTNGTIVNNTTSCTTDANDSWLEVDFGQMRTINRIVLFNDSDIDYQTYLCNFRISARGAGGEELVGEDFFTESGNAGASLTWNMPASMDVRKVRIQFLGTRAVDRGYLLLAEVQAYEYVPAPDNWALASQGSVATQSGQSVYPASNAIDGNTNGDPTLTDDAVDSWWQVDFGQDRLTNRIVLHNNSFSQPELLSSFRISLLDGNDLELIGRNYFTDGGHADDALTWDIPVTVIARKVKIQILGKNLANNGYLSLCEVQAFLSGNRHETTTHSDGTRSRNVHSGGRICFTEKRDSTSANGGMGNLLSATSFGYDIYGRLVSSHDSRTGTTATAYVSTTCDAVAAVKDPGGRVTAYTYDSRGRRLATDAPDTGTSANITYCSYYPTSRVKAQWGDLAYPTFTTYDYAGRVKTLHTWQSPPSLTQTTAVPPGNSATTTWNYSVATGRLTSKLDHLSHGPTYTHTPAGRLLTRTWARDVTTTYGYTAGRLTAVNYSDATPDVEYTRDRLGRIDTITQDKQSQLAYTYAADLGPDTETISYDINHDGDFLDATDLVRTLDRSDRSFGRDTGWQLKDGGTTEHQADYTYDTAGRLSTAADAANTFTYGYSYNQTTANDPRVGSTTGTLKEDFMPFTLTKNGTVVLQTLRTYEATRDALAVIQNKADITTRSSYTYTENALGQRTGLTTTFNLAGNTVGPLATSWGYDSLGQLTAADLPGADIDRAFGFDSIGNRLTSAKGTFTTQNNVTTFTAGTNGLTEYFGAVANNTPSDPGANALNQYAAIETGTTSVRPGHDDDGNATAYPLPRDPAANSDLVWDAENRLVSATVNGGTTTYLYDALSRRIAKIPTSGSATLYICDGFNCIAEYTGTTLSKTRTWGLDLSGTLHGAGGVGGLLAEKQGGIDFYPTYDGNGNVSEYLAVGGATAAHFEYDPFGNITVDTDNATTPWFAYRFSTKPLDFETGLYYYGYRYYDPLTGRWPSRDPIGEKGGENLYGFVGNHPTISSDRFGLYQNKDEALNAARDAVGIKSSNSRITGLAEVEAYLPKPPYAFNPGPMSGSDAVLYWLNEPSPDVPRFSTGVAGVEYSATVFCCPNRLGDHYGYRGPLRGKLPSRGELIGGLLGSVEINGWPDDCNPVAFIHSHTMTQLFVNNDGALSSSTNFLPNNGGPDSVDLAIGRNAERYLVHEYVGVYILVKY